MDINQITVSGFRNVKKCTLKFDQLISLISTNNYGKSNALNAIKYGIDFIKSDERTKKMFMKHIKNIPLNKYLENYNYKIDFDLSTIINDKIYFIKYGYEFIWYKNNGSGCKINKEYLKIKSENDKKYTIFVDRDIDNATYKSSDKGRCSTKISIKDEELIINKLKAFDTLYYYSIINELNSLNMHIERHLDASSLYEDSPLIRIDGGELELNDYNALPRVLSKLKIDAPERFELLIDSFKKIFPDIKEVKIEILTLQNNRKFMPENIPFRLANEVYKIIVEEKNLNQPIDFECMSDGVKRIFLQLAMLIILDYQGCSIIAIEEPENSIHPMLFQTYLRIIEQFRGKAKVVITSHSPYLLKYLCPSKIYIGVPNNCGFGFFSKIRKSKEKQIESMANKYNQSIGDYIFELLNGDEDDINELKDSLEVDIDE